MIKGKRTGVEPSAYNLEELRNLIRDKQIEIPLLVGSGISPENAFDFIFFCDGLIIGSYFRKGGVTGQPIELKILKMIVELIKEVDNKRWD